MMGELMEAGVNALIERCERRSAWGWAATSTHRKSPRFMFHPRRRVAKIARKHPFEEV
jgi:hypothetical protein